MLGEFYALICAVNWSLCMVFTKKAQNRKNALEPMIGLFLTIFVNNIVNLIAVIIRHFVWHPVEMEPAGLILFAIGGTLNSFIGRGLLFVSVAMLGAARAGLMKTFVPVFAVIGGVYFLGERLGSRAWLGIAIVLFGLFLMSWDSARRIGKKSHKNTDMDDDSRLDLEKKKAVRIELLKGVGVGIVAAFFLGSGNVCRKAGLTLVPDTVIANTVCSIFALAVCVIVLLIRRKGREMLSSIKHFDINYGISGLFTSGALYTLFMAMRHIPISIANSLSATEPLFTILFVWLMKEGKKERLGIQFFFFGIIMVIGTIILIMK